MPGAVAACGGALSESCGHDPIIRTGDGMATPELLKLTTMQWITSKVQDDTGTTRSRTNIERYHPTRQSLCPPSSRRGSLPLLTAIEEGAHAERAGWRQTRSFYGPS